MVVVDFKMSFSLKFVTRLAIGGRGVRNKSSRACFKLHPRSTTGSKKLNPQKVAKFNEVRSIFTTSPLLVIYHYGSLTTKEWDDVRYQLDDKGIKMKVLHSKITQKAIEGTVYENMSPLFRGSTAIAYSNQSFLLSDLFKATKKESKLLLMGGLVEDQLLTPLGLEKFSKLPEKIVLQQELLSTLKLATSKVCSVLSMTPLNLVQLLDRAATDK